MSDIPYVDFRSGMVSERLRRRSDLSFYANSASLIENAVPLRTGGVCQREGLSKQISVILNGAEKIVPVVKDDENYFILAFSPATFDGNGNLSSEGKMYICSPNENGDGYKVTTQPNKYYTSDELDTICVANTFDKIIITQRNHYPKELKYNSTGTRFDEMRDFVPVTKYSVYRDGELQNESSFTYLYDKFLNKKNKNWYPAGCAFVANRLVFYGFNASPYSFVMSHPFEYDDFTESVKYVKSVSKMSSEKYLDAVAQLQTTETTEIENYSYNGNVYALVYRRYERSVSSTGYYMTTITYVDHDTAQVITSEIATEELESDPVWNSTTGKWSFVFKAKPDGTFVTKKGVVYFSKNQNEYVETITDDCAIFLELASDRDERICWLGQVGDYVYVGTTSSEWIIPSSVTATQVQCSKLASYGSDTRVRHAYGMRNLFYVQVGRKKIRSVQYTQDGPAFSEISYTCPELFDSGIMELVWQKVPEPRMYVRTGNANEIAVYCYDVDYGVNAWCRWTFAQNVLSLCVLDTNAGQEVFVLMQDGMLYKFTEGKLSDDTLTGTSPFIAKVVTNNLENSTSLAVGKKNYTIYADTDGTGFSACSLAYIGDEGRPIPCRVVNRQLSKIEAYSTYPKDQGVRIKIQGNAGERFTLLALIIDLEVAR